MPFFQRLTWGFGSLGTITYLNVFTALALYYLAYVLKMDEALVMAVLICYSLGFTIFNVPYLTIPVEMTTDRMQRLSLMSYRSVFMMVGAALGASFAPAMLEFLGGNRSASAYQAMGLTFGAIVLLAMLTAFRGTRWNLRRSAGETAEAVVMAADPDGSRQQALHAADRGQVHSVHGPGLERRDDDCIPRCPRRVFRILRRGHPAVFAGHLAGHDRLRPEAHGAA